MSSNTITKQWTEDHTFSQLNNKELQAQGWTCSSDVIGYQKGRKTRYTCTHPVEETWYGYKLKK